MCVLHALKCSVIYARVIEKMQSEDNTVVYAECTLEVKKYVTHSDSGLEVVPVNGVSSGQNCSSFEGGIAPRDAQTAPKMASRPQLCTK